MRRYFFLVLTIAVTLIGSYPAESTRTALLGPQFEPLDLDNNRKLDSDDLLRLLSLWYAPPASASPSDLLLLHQGWHGALPSFTPTALDTSTPSGSLTETPTLTVSPTATWTSTRTIAPSPSFTPTFTLSSSPIPSHSPTRTPTPTRTSTPSRTATYTLTPTFTKTSTVTFTPTQTPTPTFGKVFNASDVLVFVGGTMDASGVESVDLWKVSPDGAGLQIILEDLDPLSKILYSPDHRRVAVYGNDSVYRIVAVNGEVPPVTKTLSSGPDENFDWSPDGGTILFSDYGGQSSTGGGLNALNLNTLEVSRIYSDYGGYAHVPAYSPTGASAAFVVHSYGTSYSLKVMNSTGTHIRTLAGGTSGHDEDLFVDWKDEKTLLLGSTQTTGPLYLLPTDSTNETTIENSIAIRNYALSYDRSRVFGCYSRGALFDLDEISVVDYPLPAYLGRPTWTTDDECVVAIRNNPYDQVYFIEPETGRYFETELMGIDFIYDLVFLTPGWRKALR